MAASMSLPLEPVRVEFQRPTVLGHRPHHLVAGSLRQVRCDLKPDCDVGADLADEVRNHFLRNPSGVAANTSSIQRHSSEESPNRRHWLTMSALFLLGESIN